MVILKDEKLTPGEWDLGRVFKLKPGNNKKKVRVLKIKRVLGIVTMFL